MCNPQTASKKTNAHVSDTAEKREHYNFYMQSSHAIFLISCNRQVTIETPSVATL